MSKIEWCERTWNPIVGCQKVSPGCANCYAEKMAQRLRKMEYLPQYRYITEDKGWTGRYGSNLTSKRLPTKPSVIFVCSMSDLFYDGIATPIVHEIYSIMAEQPQHTFIVCTKRPERIIPVLYDSGYLQKGESLDNVWHLTSVENQEWADKRIPELCELAMYGPWKLGLSIEPMLGSINWNTILPPRGRWLTTYIWWRDYISQIIVGGESGPKARPMHPDWARSIRDQCAAAGVPFFFKQWGEWLPSDQFSPHAPDKMLGYKGHNFNDEDSTYKIGKKKAGRLLDRKEHNELAWMK